jgi:hypothetical protein
VSGKPPEAAPIGLGSLSAVRPPRRLRDEAYRSSVRYSAIPSPLVPLDAHLASDPVKAAAAEVAKRIEWALRGVEVVPLRRTN